MIWFYAIGNERKGPVEKAEIERLAREGVINQRTLVWREGMADWMPLGELTRSRGNASPSMDEEKQADEERITPETAAPTDSRPGGGLAVRSREEAAENDRMPAVTATCRECGRNFPEDDTILLGGVRICAECKPLVLQKMKEGSRPGRQMAFGGFWRRFFAKCVDSLLMAVINSVFVGGVIALLFRSPDLLNGGEDTLIMMQAANFLLGTLAPLAYSTWFLGKFGATPGKMALGLRVVSSDGSDIRYQRALGRGLMEWVSGIILCIGYLMAAFDEEKRTLHDRACDTRVIRTR